MQLHAYGQNASTTTSLTNFELMDVLAVLGLPKLAGFSVKPVASKVRTQFAIKLRWGTVSQRARLKCSRKGPLSGNERTAIFKNRADGEATVFSGPNHNNDPPNAMRRLTCSYPLAHREIPTLKNCTVRSAAQWLV